MDDLHALIKAVANNEGEDTPAAMLADHLIERGDSRGDIIKKALEGKYTLHKGGVPIGRREYPRHSDSQVSQPLHLQTRVVRGLYSKSKGSQHEEWQPVFSVSASDSKPEGSGNFREFSIRVPDHSEAREIADRLPNSEEVHKFLDTHFGPDPRVKKFAAAYNTALKYGKAPAEGIGTFVREAGGSEVHHHNTHDAVLADYLQEHEDPREVIVRQHLAGTAHPDGGGEVRGVQRELQRRLGLKYEAVPFGSSFLDTPEGHLHFRELHSPETGATAIRTHWAIKHPDGHGYRHYHAVLSPAEVEQIKHHVRDGNRGLTPPDQLAVNLE